MRAAPKLAGFTLIEMMVTVAIIGVLAATAIPAFIRYTRKARTTEARQNLKKIYDGARIYYMDPHYASVTDIQPVPAQFPAGDFSTSGQDPTCCIWNPASENPLCPPSVADWDEPRWIALHFSMTEPHYFAYGYGAYNSGNQYWNATASADQDCDGIWSFFQVMGFADRAYGDGPLGTGKILRDNELE